jgi:cell division protein ZapA
LRIKPEEEEAVRKGIKLADEKIAEMKVHFTGKDDIDFMAMTLLSYAADSAVDVLNNPILVSEVDAMIGKIDKALEQ